MVVTPGILCVERVDWNLQFQTSLLTRVGKVRAIHCFLTTAGGGGGATENCYTPFLDISVHPFHAGGPNEAKKPQKIYLVTIGVKIICEPWDTYLHYMYPSSVSP